MPFPFVYMCDLLDKIEGICVRDVPLLRKDRVSRTKDSMISWFTTHSWRINAQDTDSSTVLMMLKPERQTDRDYGLEEHLEQILARIFRMPTPMFEKLKRWRDEAHNHGDLGLRLCQILQEMKVTPSSATASKISAEEIDQSLLRIAIFNDRSSLAVKSLVQPDEKCPDRIEVLEALYTRLQPREAKWLTRIILKNYGPATLPDSFLLPGNVSHLPNSIPATFKFPLEPPVPTRRIGTRIMRGIGSNELMHPLPTPPTSSPMLPVSAPKGLVKKPTHRIRIGWDPQSSNLSASVVPTTSSSLSTSSHRTSTTPSTSEQRSYKLISPPTSSSPFKPSVASTLASSKPPYKRSALGQISSNVPSGSQSQHSQPQSQETLPKPSSRTSSSTPKPQVNSHPKTTPSQTLTLSTAHSLSSSPSQSPFSSSLLILSPSLPANRHLLHTLIPHHNAHTLSSLSTLAHPSLPRRTKSGRLLKKYILVDITFPEQTLQFCKRAERVIRALGWRNRRGGEERVPIFDWRVLELAREGDREGKMGRDAWRKHFQGVI